MRVDRRPLLFVVLLATLAAPAAALSPPEFTAAVSPAAPTTADLVEVTLFHASLTCPLRPIDVVVTAGVPDEGYDHVVRVRLARANGQFLCQEIEGPSFALGPLEPGEYLVEVAWDDQRRGAEIFTATGPPPQREGSGPFARPLPLAAAHEIVIEDVEGLANCATRTFDLAGIDVDGSLVHVFFEERRFDTTCAGLAFPGDVRAVVGSLPAGVTYTAVVWSIPDVQVLKPQILWGTTPLVSADIGGTCATTPDQLCLGGRFLVRVIWRAGEAQGAGQPVPLTRDTGAFWFFDRENLELVVKALDACDPFGRHWVFLSGLTDVEVEVQVLDAVTGDRRVYRSETGEDFQPIFDTNAFTCP